MNKAVFLDKDGTLIYDLPYNVNPNLLTWKEDSFEALKTLAANGYLLVVVTNQSGVARGIFTEADLVALGEAMKQLLAEQEIPLAGFYYCPHFKEGTLEQYTKPCDCRKPAPGMLINAARDLQIDLQASWMIGDMLKDVEAGKAAGCSTILVEGSDQSGRITSTASQPSYIAASLLDAAKYILSVS
ncbi:MAG: HAD family hydrolase [Chitinophagaceae bacterium]|nr:HAD family hydrolase [Chitinophagaceae bacterium]